MLKTLPRKASMCQLHNIFSSDLFLLVWLQSGCYVGGDTLTINCANRELFWGTQERRTGLISSLWTHPSMQQTLRVIVAILGFIHGLWIGEKSKRRFLGSMTGSSPRNPWERVPPALRASWRGPRHMGGCARSVNTKMFKQQQSTHCSKVNLNEHETKVWECNCVCDWCIVMLFHAANYCNLSRCNEIHWIY